MNLLKWGLTHLNTQLDDHTDEDMTIGLPGAEISIRGTLVAATERMDNGAIKIKQGHFHILVPTATLVSKNIQVFRGVKIKVGSRVFEVILGSNGDSYASEQYRNRTVIVCKELKC